MTGQTGDAWPKVGCACRLPSLGGQSIRTIGFIEHPLSSAGRSMSEHDTGIIPDRGRAGSRAPAFVCLYGLRQAGLLDHGYDFALAHALERPLGHVGQPP